MTTNEAGLWQEVAGNHERQVNRRNGIRQNQDDVLRHLGVGYALHAAQYRVEEYYDGGNQQSGRDFNFQEAGKGHTSTGHLTDHVGEGDDDQADHRNNASRLTGITLTNEVRHCVSTETTQVGSQQGCQQHVATGPAHDERGVDVTNGNQTRNRNKGSSRQPVGGRGHTVHGWVHFTTGDIELAGGLGASPDSDRCVYGKGAQHKDQVNRKLTHELVLQTKFSVEPVHSPCVENDQTKEGEDRALLCKPEAEVGTSDTDTHEHRSQNNAKAKGHCGPDADARNDKAQVGSPICLISFS